MNKKAKKTLWAGAAAVVFLAATFTLWPQIDLIVSGWFFEASKGFFLADFPVFVFLHNLAHYGARILGVFLVAATIISYARRKALWGVSAKGWLFVFLGLLLAPGLLGNVILKDHWGRARPRDVVEFSGTENFSPALISQDAVRKNGSFVSGDAAFGFYLPSFAFIVSRRQSRRFFWGGMGMGALFGLARIAMGAHFLSDVFFAAVFMLATTAGLYALMFKRSKTRS
ncbi:MAG: phosphatase PAP2 family protein [Alphaproteobacteria bacterium]|nr:phosphatase PAP2 family protein [Alphaproteobacteria bacterium]